MGFDINEKVTVELHYKDIALIATVLSNYQRMYGKDADSEVVERAERLVNKLGEALCAKKD